MMMSRNYDGRVTKATTDVVPVLAANQCLIEQ